MSFLGIAFLFALPLAAAPLLLHLFDRRRNEVIEWGAMQFLVEVAAQKTSARRLKQWLLLLMRCLVIAAMIFALARPMLPSGYLGGNDRGETIFVIDNSMSMSRKVVSGDMIHVAVERAIERLGELPSHEDVRILTTAPYPEWVGSGTVPSDRRNRQWITEQLTGLEATQGRSDLLAALFTAIQVEHQPDQNARRIVVLTDGQAADWRLEDTAGWKRLHEVLNETPVRTEIETIRLDQEHAAVPSSNLGIDDVTLDRLVVGVGWPITANATLHNYSAATTDAAKLAWQIDGEELERQSIEPIEAGQTLEANWRHAFEMTGTYRLSCHIDREDDLPADNTSSLVVEVVDRIPIVIVEGAFDLAEMQQDSYFVQAALGWIDGQPLRETSIYVPTLVTPEELSTTDLTKQRVVIVPNLTQLPQEAVAALTEFVVEGGGLWIGLGPRTNVDFYNHQLFADASGLAPLRIDRIIDSVSSGFVSAAAEEADAEADDVFDENSANNGGVTSIDPFRSDHPATRRLADNDQLDLADAVIRRHYRFVTGEHSEDLSVLIRLNDGTPLAAENFVGRGRVIVQGLPLRLQWSDLARTQSFVVMVRDWIDYLAEPRATQYNLQPGQPIVYRLAESESSLDADTESTDASTGLLQMPRGEPVELMAQATDNAIEFRSSRTRLPGDYQLEIGLADRKIPFQVKRSAGESNLAMLEPGDWQRINAAVTANPSTERLSQATSTQADPVWPYFLIAVIALIMGELVLSGIMARERFGSAGIPEFSEMDTPVGGFPPLGDTVDRNDRTSSSFSMS